VPALNDVFRITDFQTLFGEEVLNVFFYRVTAIGTPTPTLADIALNFQVTVQEPIEGIQASQVFHNLLRLENLMNAAEFLDETLTGQTGTVTGECMPSFTAWSLLMRRTTKLTRNGSKRIAGVLEAWVQNGVFVGLDANMEAAQDALAAVIEGTFPPAAYELTPVIVGRTPSGLLDLTRQNIVRAGEFRGPSTQNSRKVLL